MDEEKLAKKLMDEEQRAQRKLDKEQRLQDKLDEENYLKTIQWPKSDDEWIKYDFKKLKAGTLMPFKTPPRHQIEPELPRNPDGTIIIIDHKQVEIDKLKAQLEALPEGKQLKKLEEQQKQIDMLQESLINVINELNNQKKNKIK